MYLAGGNGLRCSTSHLRASSGYFEPERIRSLQPHHFSVRPAVVLVTIRRFPPPRSIIRLARDDDVAKRPFPGLTTK